MADIAFRSALPAGQGFPLVLRDRLLAPASQQEGLRRVATLVARVGGQSEVFSTVAEEMARCLNVENADVFRYQDNGATIVVVAAYAEAEVVPDHTVGERLTTEGDNISSKVWCTQRAARMDSYEGAAGAIAERVRMLGLRSRVGAPIMVDERVWGMVVVGNSQPEPLPPDTEQRVTEFADLAATAIAAAGHAELIASRARIVAAADDARRRIERDLHDGAQQRLIALGLKVRTAMDQLPAGLDSLNAELADVACALTAVLEKLREISHGIHPAILSRGGLSAALKALARRSAVPVTLDVAIEAEVPDSVEIAAYYITAEALANAAKHAQASEVMVCARTVDEP